MNPEPDLAEMDNRFARALGNKRGSGRTDRQLDTVVALYRSGPDDVAGAERERVRTHSIREDLLLLLDTGREQEVLDHLAEGFALLGECTQLRDTDGNADPGVNATVVIERLVSSRQPNDYEKLVARVSNVEHLLQGLLVHHTRATRNEMLKQMRDETKQSLIEQQLIPALLTGGQVTLDQIDEWVNAALWTNAKTSAGDLLYKHRETYVKDHEGMLPEALRYEGNHKLVTPSLARRIARHGWFTVDDLDTWTGVPSVASETLATGMEEMAERLQRRASLGD